MARTPKLFQPIALRSVEARNRIAVSPMCQYSANDGLGDDWHVQTLGAKAAGGAGIVFTEATHVSAAGRITPHCLGLWNDAQQALAARLAAVIVQSGAVPGIQLAHAGRKASSEVPWRGGAQIPREAGGWQTLGPSAVPYAPGQMAPDPLSAAAVADIAAEFAAAARRAREAGFRIVELHGAHGYLIHSFLSPLSNRRSDAYGGDLTGRARLLMEVLDAVRSEWPEQLPLALRLSCSDWVEGGLAIDEVVELARKLRARGDVDLIDCSSGGNSPEQAIPTHPGYQVPFAERIRREAGIMTGAVGMIRSATQADEVVANGRADLVLLGRVLLADPGWPIRAAQELGAEPPLPVQYRRSVLG